MSDPDKKKRYDQFGHQGMGGATGGAGGFSGQGMSMEDIFSHFGDIFGGHSSGGSGGFGGFGGFGGSSYGGGQARAKENKGSDLRINIKITLQEIAKGVEKKIKVKKWISCNSWNGTGAANGTSFHNFSTCNGSGRVK